MARASHPLQIRALASEPGNAASWLVRSRSTRILILLWARRILRRIDGEPIWSDLFVRRQTFPTPRYTVALLKAAIDHVRQRGGKILSARWEDSRRLLG